MGNDTVKVPDLSVIMPCRNEACTVGECIDAVGRMLEEHGINGEIIVADNSSSDFSAAIAREHGAKVVCESEIGYGLAIRRGMEASTGKVILIGDCDMTYDFSEGAKMYRMITEEGYDMVIGDRFKGRMEKGAMSPVHAVGVKFLSAVARARFGCDVNDFHSGIRALSADAAAKLKLHTKGMEFATEMIARAYVCGLKIGQIPVTLRRSPGGRRSKLRTFRDGMRHLVYIMTEKQKRQG